MAKIKTCKGCGVPQLVSKEQEWLDNGVIRQKRTQAAAWSSTKPKTLSSLFAGIEEISAFPSSTSSSRASARTSRGIPKRLSATGAQDRPPYRFRRGGREAEQHWGLLRLRGHRARGGPAQWRRRRLPVHDHHRPPFPDLLRRGGAGRLGGHGRARQLSSPTERSMARYKVTVHVGKHPIELSERLERQTLSLQARKDGLRKVLALRDAPDRG